MAADTGTKKSSTRKRSGGNSSSSSRRGSAPRAAAPKRMSGSDAAAAAARQLGELTGRGAEEVTGLERAEEGWKVSVEVVELHRVPNTTDVLGLYEVEVDEHGDLQGYRRLRRYTRGETVQD